MKRIYLYLFVILLLFSSVTYAHSGRTDSEGGHRDNRNKSGLGYYHYHHGYGPHLHRDGICPYAPTDKITVQNMPKSLKVGESKLLSWTVTYYSGSSYVDWQSSDYSIISIDSNGQLFAKKPGTVKITAIMKNGRKVFNVKSSEVYANVFNINELPEKLLIDSNYSLVYSVLPSNTTDKKVRWASSNSDIATIDDSGKITTYTEGYTTITGTTKNGLKNSFLLKVYQIHPTKIEVEEAKFVMSIGDTKRLNAKVLPSDTTNPEIEWNISNDKIAKINKKGMVTALSEGNVDITIKCQDINSVVNIEVEPVKAEKISFEKNSIPFITNSVLQVGEKFEPIVIFDPDNTTYKDITLISSNEDNLSINNNKVYAVGLGSATLIAKSKDTSVSIDIIIINYYIIIGIIISIIFLIVAVILGKKYREK